MTAAWVILALAAGTYGVRLAGVLLHDRLVLPDRLKHLLPIAAVTLLAALVATSVFTDGDRISIGLARPAGVLVGAVLAWRKAPFVVVVVAAAAVAAGLRLLGIR
ncbi:branched-subunit amino acid transport protein [Allocatelliglobosispora scoriae]|uniref:Branched-subunit amino acid transport protein n=1 Tax=Allocatelliglobosispora scoriae TaxID=643052 RepID=A0A841BK60_9ACTN|nr:AzlD domain-containing protein [Allocatelliglobosispora scoriae]MBB5869487.1 branched-subunit amino acid transport protein [Allocatelliglobosispora scoriae]